MVFLLRTSRTLAIFINSTNCLFRCQFKTFVATLIIIHTSYLSSLSFLYSSCVAVYLHALTDWENSLEILSVPIISTTPSFLIVKGGYYFQCIIQEQCNYIALMMQYWLDQFRVRAFVSPILIQDISKIDLVYKIMRNLLIYLHEIILIT